MCHFFQDLFLALLFHLESYDIKASQRINSHVTAKRRPQETENMAGGAS
jgi:hypothetical protein